MPFNVNNLSLQIAKIALQNTIEMEKYCEIIATNRQQIYDFLVARNIEVCESKGNFLLFKVKPEIKQVLSSFMNKNEIKIKTSLNGLPNWVRITIPEKIDLLLTVLKTVFQPEIIGFDMDGVLIDTSESYDLCILETVKYFTNKTLDISQVIQLREQGGFNNDWELTLQLLQQLDCWVLLDEVITQFQKYYVVFKKNERNLLKQKILFENNTITAIITGRPRDEARNGVKQLAIEPDFIISADDVNQQKPSPEGIKWLKSFTGKNLMWFCGDTVDDMQAGKAANCVCIGIGQNEKNLYQSGADIVLNNINQLEDLL
jgi:histidinol-phosphate aminotransferase